MKSAVGFLSIVLVLGLFVGLEALRVLAISAALPSFVGAVVVGLLFSSALFVITRLLGGSK